MATPVAPGVGARRNHLPKLPLSAFTASPAESSTPGAPPPVDPASIEPTNIIDAHFNFGSESDPPTVDTESKYSIKLKSVVVVFASPDGVDKLLAELKGEATAIPIKAVIVPMDFNVVPSVPNYVKNPPFPTSVFSTVSRTSITPSTAQGVAWAIDNGLPVELDVEGSAADEVEGYEYLAELISSAQEASQKKPTPIILTNVLPPQSSVDLPIVKLLSHPGYIAYQSYVGSLSLVPNTFLKFTPPTWDVKGEGENGLLNDEQVREWKRRVKMYLGPAVEAFGQDRILFGASAASKDGTPRIKPSDWYTLARESLVEIGVEQDGVDAIFELNATAVYSPSSTL